MFHFFDVYNFIWVIFERMHLLTDNFIFTPGPNIIVLDDPLDK